MSVLEFFLIALAVLAASVLGFGFYQISQAGSPDNTQARRGAAGKPGAPADRYGFRRTGLGLRWREAAARV